MLLHLELSDAHFPCVRMMAARGDCFGTATWENCELSETLTWAALNLYLEVVQTYALST